MPSSIHHVSCLTDDGSVAALLQEVVELPVYDRFTVPAPVLSSMFGWPAANPGASGCRYGAGPNGLVEVISVPAQLTGAVTTGVNFVTFAVRDLEARLERCRRLGFQVGDITRFAPTGDIELAAAVVTVGGVAFELASYTKRR